MTCLLYKKKHSITLRCCVFNSFCFLLECHHISSVFHLPGAYYPTLSDLPARWGSPVPTGETCTGNPQTECANIQLIVTVASGYSRLSLGSFGAIYMWFGVRWNLCLIAVIVMRFLVVQLKTSPNEHSTLFLTASELHRIDMSFLHRKQCYFT